MTAPDPKEQAPDLLGSGVPIEPALDRLTARVDGVVGFVARDDDIVVQIGASVLFEQVTKNGDIKCSKRSFYEAVSAHPLVERRDSGLCWIYPTVEAKEAFFAPEIVALAGPELSDILQQYYISHQGGRVKQHPRRGRGRNWKDARARGE